MLTRKQKFWVIIAQVLFNVTVAIISVSIFGMGGIFFTIVLAMWGEIYLRKKFDV